MKKQHACFSEQTVSQRFKYQKAELLEKNTQVEYTYKEFVLQYSVFSSTSGRPCLIVPFFFPFFRLITD